MRGRKRQDRSPKPLRAVACSEHCYFVQSSFKAALPFPDSVKQVMSELCMVSSGTLHHQVLSLRVSGSVDVRGGPWQVPVMTGMRCNAPNAY